MVRCYSTKTAKRVREFSSLSSVIVGFSVHYLNGYEQIIACSSTGEIISWKLDTGVPMVKRVSK